MTDSLKLVRDLSEGRLTRDPVKGGTRPGIGSLQLERERARHEKARRDSVVAYEDTMRLVPVKGGITAAQTGKGMKVTIGRRNRQLIPQEREEAKLTRRMRERGMTTENFRFVPRNGLKTARKVEGGRY
jgi:hypothetical protein